MTPTLVVHCDWGKAPGKRWMAVAAPDGRRWRLDRPEPVARTDDLLDRLSVRADGGRILIGFDFPIGLPAAYGRKIPFARFSEALAAFGHGEWSNWYAVCEGPDEISIHRPFYPSRPGGRRRVHLRTGLDLSDTDLLRACERRTDGRRAACALFWTLGGNQVGKGAITGWREVLAPNRERIGIWPFDGTLAECLERTPLVIVETYPGEAYGHLRIGRVPRWSKGTISGRQSVAEKLVAWMTDHATPDAGLVEFVSGGFGSRPRGEDQFDALVGLMSMIDVVEGRRSEGNPVTDDVLTWEGWILGMHPPPARSAPNVLT